MTLRTLSVVIALAAVFLPVPFGPPAAAAARSFSVAPVPSWVALDPLGPAPDVAVGDVPKGAHTLLLDRQTRVTNAGSERYYRRAEHILSATGLDSVSQLQLEFEPSFERLVIHYIRIVRDGSEIDQLEPSEIKVIQQENELDERLYNGTLSAIVFLDDVRVGDVVDYAFSVIGDNPVLEGKFADSFYLATDDPIHRLRNRLLWPSGRTLHRSNLRTDLQPVERVLTGETELLWDLRDVPATIFEDDTPGWFDPTPRVQVSEFGTWSDVVNWALPLFEVEKPLAPSLDRQIEAWRVGSEDPAARLVTAVRFVQDDVRYLGIELGPYSHLPNEPSTVFERRFGDCKDKTLLLVTILTALGIEAYPALVNTDSAQALDAWQPSPFAFNHAIAQVLLDGQTYWIDATFSLQRGDLSQYYSPTYARALVVRPESSGLTTIPPPVSDRPAIEVTSVYELDAKSPAATLDVVTTYRGLEADEIRYRLTQHSRAEVGRLFLNYYSSSDPNIEAVGLPDIEDDAGTNTVLIRERYRTPKFWDDGARMILADRIESELDAPRISRRSAPLAVSYPVDVAQRIEVRLGRDPGVEDDSGTIEDGVTRFDFKRTVEADVLVLEYRLRTLADNVPPDRVRAHLETIEKVRENLELQLDEEPLSAAPGTWIWLGVLFMFVLLPLFIGIVRHKGARANDPLAEGERPPPSPPRQEPGLRPDTALALPQGDLGLHVVNLSCSCGTRYGSDAIGSDRQSLTFDGRKLVVVGLACGTCGTSRDMYFVPSTGGS
jgi:transglutaminase-like putative cysteine protease